MEGDRLRLYEKCFLILKCDKIVRKFHILKHDIIIHSKFLFPIGNCMLILAISYLYRSNSRASSQS